MIIVSKSLSLPQTVNPVSDSSDILLNMEHIFITLLSVCWSEKVKICFKTQQGRDPSLTALAR